MILYYRYGCIISLSSMHNAGLSAESAAELCDMRAWRTSMVPWRLPRLHPHSGMAYRIALKVYVRPVLTPFSSLIYILQHVCEGKILCSEIVWAADLAQRCYEEVSDVIQREQEIHRRPYLDLIVMRLCHHTEPPYMNVCNYADFLLLLLYSNDTTCLSYKWNLEIFQISMNLFRS